MTTLVAELSAGTTLAAAAVALAGFVIVFWAVRRLGHGTDRRMDGLMAELDRRMTEIHAELAAAIELEQEQNRRARLLAELTSSIDVDEVLRRTIEVAASLSGVDAVHLAVTPSTGEPILRHAGLSAREADELVVGPALAGRRVRSLDVAYRGDVADERTVVSGLALPLRSGEAAIGMLTLFSRAEDHTFSEAERETAEALAARAGPAIENASRYQEARRLADVDTRTGLHNDRYFHDTLAREVSRSERYKRPLAVLLFDLDDFKEINDRLGHLAGNGVLEEIGERVRAVVRTSDIACRVGGDEFGVILPESTLEEAEQLFERLKNRIGQQPIPHAGRLQISAGIAAARSQDDAVSLFERADDALYRAKEAGKGRVAVATTAIGRAATEVKPSAISRIEGEER
jgi:diguanylate cyclase (GGDEF)-like protein